MTDKRQLIPIAGFIALVAVAMYMVTQLRSARESPYARYHRHLLQRPRIRHEG
jgi:hypothetical protein